MSDLHVNLDPPYPVRLRATFAQAWAELRRDHGERRWLVIADRTLLQRCPQALAGLSRRERAGVVAVHGGERVKSLRTLAALARAALDARADRQTLVIAVGGGTVGDAVGLFAATYLRGIAWCPLATTSLALADSAIGGKTAVNGAGVKNLIGAFHQPVGVYGALEALRTLPRRHRVAGLAEVVKCGAIADRALFALLERTAPRLAGVDLEAWEAVLRRANAVKARIVARDPREEGPRALLNFGHTVGHALEATQRPRLLHGEAISLGMIAASWISERRGLAPAGTLSRVRALLTELGLPVERDRGDSASVLNAVGYDKKSRAGEARMVLTHGVGSATFGHRIERTMLGRSLRFLSGAPPHSSSPSRPGRVRPHRVPRAGAGR